jgi:predicted ATPase/class 3 adenylate cyclase
MESPTVPAIPSGTVTFLFTDIEGSTARWERHPQTMRAALARHDALLHAGIAAHHGVVLTERGEGDSFFALFARPSDALAAACALQQSLAAESWPAEVAPIHVRLALHTGEAGLREGSDYRGVAVNRCARLRAVAHGGQVLLSGATYELVRDQFPPAVSLRDLGEHRLKDLTRPEHIFQVLIPGLPTEFPPLKTLDTLRHNLPVQPTALIGREREVVAVRGRLLEPDMRLLTLSGPGGIGKTRLALQVAAEVLEAFSQGVFFVNLAPLSATEVVLPTIAQTLGVTEAGGQPLRETLHAFLRDKQLLLVLDNFEQVLDAASVVAELLAACAQVRVLVTSRAALHLRGEREFAVPPLALPDTSPLPPLERLTQYGAVRLFIERAQDIQPAFAVSNETAPAVAAICVRLDGLPLAIELAAARVRLFTPPALLSLLSHRLGVLTGGARDLPARQRTLRATIDWSYALLTKEEQTLFARLAVFVGGWTLEAIEAVCSADGTLDALGGVESLLAKSLLGQTEVEGEMRFVLLETIHEYARERLEVSREAEAVHRAHATYFLALAEEAETRLKAPRHTAWLERLEREHDNLRAALRWAREGGEAELGLRLAGALWLFWYKHGHLSEGRAWLEDLLARAELGEKVVQPAVRARALLWASTFATEQGDYGRAAALYEESEALCRELGDTWGLAWSLNVRGEIARRQGDYTGALTLHEKSAALFRLLDERWGIAMVLNNLGAMARDQGDNVRAAALYEESLAMAREIGDTWSIAMILGNLGEVACDQGDYERAVALCDESLSLFRDLGEERGMAHALTYLGVVARERGDDERALALYKESLTLWRHVGEQSGIAMCLEGLAGAACALAYAVHAARLLGAAAALRERIGAPVPPADQPDYERTVMGVRSTLGHAFLPVWEVGQALPLDQVLNEALTIEGATGHGPSRTTEVR